jgi:hypothetical protein
MQTYLHKDIIISSDKQTSAQGSVFYCKKKQDPSKELVLKIYNSNEMNSYYKEISVFKSL